MGCKGCRENKEKLKKMIAEKNKAAQLVREQENKNMEVAKLSEKDDVLKGLREMVEMLK